MKKSLSFLIILCSINTNAQNYLISFAGTGSSTSVESVKVENLTAGTSLVMNGTDILRLIVITTGVNPIDDTQSSDLKIFPNPMSGSSIVQIYPGKEGDAIVAISDINGKLLATAESFLNRGLQEYRISGLKSGFYLVSVRGNGYSYSAKLLSNSTSNGAIGIEKIRNSPPIENMQVKKTDSKGVQGTVDMSYTTGDRINFTGKSGPYSTVKTDIPAGDKTISFNFVPCTDDDNINYPVVKIGTQTWMARNLKTTRYSNGDLIATTTEDISSETAPKYQWAYNGNEEYVNAYGRLYTWYAAVDNHKLCPAGWHLPTDQDWTTLSNYLVNNGYGYQGDRYAIAKSLAAASGWTPTTRSGQVGYIQSDNNSSGFTGIPGGYRDVSGIFTDLGSRGFWWSSTECDSLSAFTYILSAVNSFVYPLYYQKSWSLSIRCIKD
jgi:uncharacterized protein (TIGR02145 family)